MGGKEKEKENGGGRDMDALLFMHARDGRFDECRRLVMSEGASTSFGVESSEDDWVLFDRVHRRPIWWSQSHRNGNPSTSKRRAPPEEGDTLFHIAVKDHRDALLLFLLSCDDVDVQVRNGKGETALDIVRSAGSEAAYLVDILEAHMSKKRAMEMEKTVREQCEHFRSQATEREEMVNDLIRREEDLRKEKEAMEREVAELRNVVEESRKKQEHMNLENEEARKLRQKIEDEYESKQKQVETLKGEVEAFHERVKSMSESLAIRNKIIKAMQERDEAEFRQERGNGAGNSFRESKSKDHHEISCPILCGTLTLS